MAQQSNTDWQAVTNQFENALRGSYKDTNTFAADHKAKLTNKAGDVTIDRLIARFNPVYSAFLTAYTAWQKSTAFWKGATAKNDALFDELLRTKMPKWDIRIQVFFEMESEEYITLFPQGRGAFRNVGKDGKIQMMATFVSILADLPDLADIHTEATAFLALLMQSRNKQQQREQAVRDASTQLRNTQKALFDAFYANLGGLMEKFYAQPEQILNFYAVEMIRTISKPKKDEEIDEIEAEDEEVDGTQE